MSATPASRRQGRLLTLWAPEDKSFWEREGEAIAKLNLWISVPAPSADGVQPSITGWPMVIGTLSPASASRSTPLTASANPSCSPPLAVSSIAALGA